MHPSEPIVVDDELLERLDQLTGGAISICYQCGVCTAACPWGLVLEDTLSVRTLIRKAQLGQFNGSEDLWLCTTCAVCQTSCPRGVDIPDVFRSLRNLAWEQQQPMKGLPSLMWSLYWNGNPWFQPPSQRTEWAKSLQIAEFDPDEHEILLYVGCTSSYDRRAQKIANALVRLLQTAGVQFGYLKDDEPCCGESALSLGLKPYFEEIAENTAAVFKKKGVHKVITISPHCYDVFKNHYQQINPNFKPLHYTQFLVELIESGRLECTNSFNGRVTFQDPCYLGRLNDEYAAPRTILNAVPGIELVEMPLSRNEALCCGGGGGRMWLETPVGERFSDLRVKEAASIDADILATACPFCIVCLEDSVKVAQLENLQVMDIAEVLVNAL
ncbi:MAG: (Fe-S)-binding protein [Anaerolineales bacterium]|nr:(Fe-S)-binding protein [Anaerolineales bacterium]